MGLINLIPPQYRIAAAIGAALLLVTAAFGAGWAVNGWRLGKAQAEARVDTLAAVIEKFGAEVEALAAISRGNVEAEARAAKAAQEGTDAILDYLAGQGGGCTLSDADARVLRENRDRRQAAREGG